MAIVDYKQSGGCDVWVLSAGQVRMDGGAMFGVVPRSAVGEVLPAR